MDAPRGVQGPGRKLSPGGNPTPPGAAVLVNDFAVKGEIEAVALHLVGDAQPDRDVDNLQDDEGDDRVVDDDRGHTFELVDELPDIAFQQARVAAELVDCEDAGQQRADDSADRMDAKGVERAVVAEGVLKSGCAPVAANPASDADHQRADRAD